MKDPENTTTEDISEAHRLSPLFPHDELDFELHGAKEQPFLIRDSDEFARIYRDVETWASEELQRVEAAEAKGETGDHICSIGLGHLLLRLFDQNVTLDVEIDGETQTLGRDHWSLLFGSIHVLTIKNIREEQQAQAMQGLLSMIGDQAPGGLQLPPGA